MKQITAVVFSVLILCVTAFPQDRGTIQCDPDMKQVMAMTGPGSAWVIDQLSCGQEVSILGLEKGYLKIQLGNRIGYVYAKYVRLPQVPKEETELPKPTVKEQQKQIPTSVPEAQTPPMSMPRKIPSNQEKILESGLGIGAELFYIRYDEPGLEKLYPGQGVFMEEKGFMFGAYGNHTFRPKYFMLKLDARFSMGNVEYSSPQGSDDIRDYIFESRITFGYDFKASDRVYLTPFGGIGYRYILDGLKFVETSALLTYDRKSNYLYSPVGLEATFGLRKGWVFGISGEYDLFWHGWQINENVRYLGEDLGGGYRAVNDQDDGWGARWSFKVAKNMGGYGIAFEPYFRYWDIDHSNVETGFGLIEPANKSREWGSRVGIRF